VFNCSDDDGDSRLHGIQTNLKIKASLSSVIMLHLHCAFFVCLCATTFTNFKLRNTHSKSLKNKKSFIFQTAKQECEIILPLLLLRTEYFGFASFPSAERR
jgi:hypothetical protein